MVTIGDDDDRETQALDTDSAPSGVRFKDRRVDQASAYRCTMPLDETLVLEDDLLFQTELARENPDLNGETQAVDDSPRIGDPHGRVDQWEDTLVVDELEEMDDVDGDEDDELGRTQVLDDDGELSDDGDTPFEIDRDNVERKIEGDQLGQQRMIASPSPCSDGHVKKDYGVDSDASTDEEGASGHVSSTSLLPSGDSSKSNPGSARRSFTTVRAASLRASGLAAARSLTPKGTDDELSIQSNGHSSKHHGSLITAQLVVKGFKEDIGTTSTGGPTSLPCTEVRELHLECEGVSQMNLHNNHMDATKSNIRNPRVRKLFNKDTKAQNEECMNEIGRKAESPHFLVDHNTIAGLSYVSSQEPGEHSQANALDVVDKLLAITDVGFLSQEAVPKEIREVKPPPFSSAKGANCLAIKVGRSSPIGKPGIFDWVDSLEDESGGEFFSKKKNCFFECTDRVKKSHSEPLKSRQHNPRKTSGKGGKKEGMNHKFHSAVKRSTHSDSRLQLESSISGDRLQILERSKKNLFKEVGKQSHAKSILQQPEAADIGTCAEDIFDVGPDTQLAAEAMEALLDGPPANLESGDAYPVTGNTDEGPFKIVAAKKTLSKSVTLRKRTSSASDSEGSRRQTKKKKMPVVKSSRRSSTISVKHVGKSRMKKNLEKGSEGTVKECEQYNTSEYLGTCKPVNEKELSEDRLSLSIGREKGRRKDGKSYRSLKSEKEGRKLDRTNLNELDRCHGPLISNGALSFGQEHMQGEHTVNATPVAHRTRQSKTMKTLECAETLSNGQSTNDLMGVNTFWTKRRRSIFFADAPGESADQAKLAYLGSKQVGECEKNIRGQLELPDIKGMHEGSAMDSLIRDASNHPKKRRTCQNKSGNSVVVTLNDVVVEVNEQYSMQQNMSKALVGTALVVPYPLKRKTRSVVGLISEVQGMPSNNKKVQEASGVKTRSSMKKHPCGQTCNENLKNQILFEPDSSRDDSSAALMNDNFPPKASCISVATMCSVGNEGAHATIHVEDARLVSSTEEKVQPSCSTPTTAMNQINIASPVCTGVDTLKLSCKNSSSRSSVARELIRLQATEAAPVPLLKDSRRRRDMASVHVLFSNHLGDDIIKQQKKILSRLGVSIASSISDATHFIADKFVRTRNMLEAIAMGKPVVTHLWLENCGQASCFIDEKNHILRDLKKEKEIGFSMPVSLERACQSPLLQGRRVYITPNTKPDRELIASLVKAAHGEPTERIGRSAIKDDRVPDNLLIISCEEDYSICTPLLGKGAEVFSSELILNGIIIQRLEYERHRLFLNNVKKTRSTIWLKSENCSQFLPPASHPREPIGRSNHDDAPSSITFRPVMCKACLVQRQNCTTTREWLKENY